jgi:thiamine biosynthesis protein ThiS
MADRNAVPRLMLVTDRHRAKIPLPALAVAAVESGVDAVQVREKDLGHEELLGLTRSVRDAVADKALVIVNGDVKVAQALEVGLHLPEHGMTPTHARKVLPHGSLIGHSVHSPAAAAQSTGAEYLIAGHVFPSRSKPGLIPLGIAGLKRIVAAARQPVLAIGGIDESNIQSVIDQGAFGVAVISAILDAPDPFNAARQLRRKIDQALETQMEQGGRLARIALTINGKEVEVDAGTTISGFLATKGLTERMVVVELNGIVLPRTAFPSTPLNAGDQVEMVHAVGGG